MGRLPFPPSSSLLYFTHLHSKLVWLRNGDRMASEARVWVKAYQVAAGACVVVHAKTMVGGWLSLLAFLRLLFSFPRDCALEFHDICPRAHESCILRHKISSKLTSSGSRPPGTISAPCTEHGLIPAHSSVTNQGLLGAPAGLAVRYDDDAEEGSHYEEAITHPCCWPTKLDTIRPSVLHHGTPPSQAVS